MEGNLASVSLQQSDDHPGMFVLVLHFQDDAPQAYVTTCYAGTYSYSQDRKKAKSFSFRTAKAHVGSILRRDVTLQATS